MNLTGQFRLSRTSFHLEVDFNLSNPNITAIFGPSGCGKTTFLRCLAGLEPDSVGQIIFNGEPWQNQAERLFIPPQNRRVGMVFQKSALFPHLNVQENIEFSYQRSQKKNFQVKEMSHLLGLSNLLKRKTTRLSGGEQQRVALARAIVSSPEILLMDEPLAALDKISRESLIPIIERISHEFKIPIIYVSHNIEEIRQIASEIVVMRQGEITHQGDIRELLTDRESPLSHLKKAASILPAQVKCHDSTFHLTHLEFSGGELITSKIDQAIGSKLRLSILAKDVSVTKHFPESSSILNIIKSQVTQINQYNPSQNNVILTAGTDRFLARVTKKSTSALDLKEGDEVFAQIKAVSLD